MENDLILNFLELPQDTRIATKHLVDELIFKVCPLVLNIKKKIQSINQEEIQDDVAKIQNSFLLCTSQIKKCFLNFLEIFRVEFTQGVFLQESRQFSFERLSWCVTKLCTIGQFIDKISTENIMKDETIEDLMFVTPMYFVNWIDYTFDVLGKLADSVYRTDYKNNEKVCEKWMGDMVEHVTSLHMCIDELLLSAITLCKYCLEEDQPALKARCQVVLRETKALFNELIKDDITAAVKVTPDRLKLPIKPSNVNILIDVLKDVLYVLETNTNTALLALLIHCYVNCASPVDVLVDHFSKRKNHFCPCRFTSLGDIDKCTVVKDFDLYNERLLQIGSFAVSCSSDQKRILSLRSCLSSLESLDPHLVPAVMTSPSGNHTMLLMNFWKQEVKEIRDTVFLIVDPVAFIERCKLFMQDMLLEMRKQDCYDNRDLWVVINIGLLVYDFFMIYKKYEPDALIQSEELDVLLENLNRAQKECKVVSELFTAAGTFHYDLHTSNGRHEITLDKFITRVHLLYSLVRKINRLFHPKDNEDQLFDQEVYDEEFGRNQNVTHTILNPNTYVNSHRKTGVNLTRSMFARTTTIKTPSQNVFLSKLTKHLKSKRGIQEELSFSVQVSELFNVEPEKVEPSPIAPMVHSALKKAMTSHQREFPFMRKLDNFFDEENTEYNVKDTLNSYLDENASLQISEVLNQINDITNIFSTTTPQKEANPSSMRNNKDVTETDEASTERVMNNTASTSMANVTEPSNVTTLDRISDLDLVESKLNSLKTNSELETTV